MVLFGLDGLRVILSDRGGLIMILLGLRVGRSGLLGRLEAPLGDRSGLRVALPGHLAVREELPERLAGFPAVLFGRDGLREILSDRGGLIMILLGLLLGLLVDGMRFLGRLEAHLGDRGGLRVALPGHLAVREELPERRAADGLRAVNAGLLEGRLGLLA